MAPVPLSLGLTETRSTFRFLVTPFPEMSEISVLTLILSARALCLLALILLPGDLLLPDGDDGGDLSLSHGHADPRCLFHFYS